MENFFEKELKNRCEGTPYSDLYTQWQTTKINIPEFLSMIRDVFPHFTIHDASHSENILSNIKKILTEEAIRNLSTTDIWMFLFVAYFHDIGMYISKEDYDKILETSQFISYIKDIQTNISNPLNKYATCFDTTKNVLKYKHTNVSLESINSIKYLIAGFFRDKHSERSEKFIKNKSLFYLPPSIPSRIINLLAAICQLHTEKNFNAVLKLNKEEDGFFDDYCHPLFIACMLRLGDVLDIDNNRFSTIVLKALPSIPSDSLIHFKKHLSIQEKHINNTEISLVAYCKDIDIGELTNNWFNLISEEILNQTKNWQNIIPLNRFPSLPAIRKLDVFIDNYDLIKGNKIPLFSFDSSKALSIIQGSGFYDSKFIFIRELLQNATDAIYLRTFVEWHDQIIDNPEEFKKKCKENYSINIFIKQNEKDNSILEFSIKDNGIGIDSDDLESIIHNGKKNEKKNELIKMMPEWMRPSGAFGMGLHSIFTIAEEFHLCSTKLNSGKKLEVLFFSPTSLKKGAVYTKTQPSNVSDLSGTQISFSFESIKIPNRLTFSSKHPSLSEHFESYDFLNYSNENFELVQIIDEIVEFAYCSYIPIKLHIDDQLIDLPQRNYGFTFFDKRSNYEITPRLHGYVNRVYYRNQIIRKFAPNHSYFSFDVNILSESADKILQISRDNLKKDYIPLFYENLDKALKTYSYEQIGKQNDLAPFMAMFLEVNNLLQIEYKKIWADYALLSENNEKYTFFQIINADKITIQQNNSLSFDEIKIEKNNNEYTLTSSYFAPEISFIKTMLDKEYFLSWNSNESLIYSKNEPSAFILNKDMFIRELKNQPNARCIIPCEKDYYDLKTKKEYAKDYPWAYVLPQCFHTRNKNIHLMIWPYKRVRNYNNNEFKIKFEKTLDENFFASVFPNLEDKSVSENRMKELYENFCKTYDELLNIT